MLLCANSLMAQLKVIIKTGGDDLRGGQGAYVQLIYKNGTVSPEFDLNGGVNCVIIQRILSHFLLLPP